MKFLVDNHGIRKLSVEKEERCSLCGKEMTLPALFCSSRRQMWHRACYMCPNDPACTERCDKDHVPFAHSLLHEHIDWVIDDLEVIK